MKIRRINLLGSSGTGKDTTASGLFHLFKKNYRQLNVELVQEFVKTWAWEKRKIEGSDQLLAFAHQLHREEFLLRNGCDFIITSSPLWLNAFYSYMNYSFGHVHINEICHIYDIDYPSINILLKRELEYNPNGRYETKEQSDENHKNIKEFLDNRGIMYIEMSPKNTDDIYDLTRKKILI